MKVIRLDRRADVRFMQILAAKLGFSVGAEVIDQLVDQLQAARAERAEAIAKLKEELDREVEALRAELAETRALLEVTQLLSRWPQDHATLQ
jgi:hypothetical protein